MQALASADVMQQLQKQHEEARVALARSAYTQVPSYELHLCATWLSMENSVWP